MMKRLGWAILGVMLAVGCKGEVTIAPPVVDTPAVQIWIDERTDAQKKEDLASEEWVSKDPDYACATEHCQGPTTLFTCVLHTDAQTPMPPGVDWCEEFLPTCAHLDCPRGGIYWCCW